MEETSSYCSGSPDRTVYTPVNGSYDDCYPQVMGQYPYLGENISGYDYGDIDKSHHTPLTSPSALRSTKCFDLKSLHDTFPESCEPYRGFFSSELSSNRYMPRPLDECSDSTRYLKLGDLDAAISGPALFKCLQDVGEVQAFNIAKLPTEGVCIVSYFDQRDAIAASIEIRANQNWTVQYCSQAYYSMLISNGGTQVWSDVICAITSGPYAPSVPSALYRFLNDFGTIDKFTSLKSVMPTFLMSFPDHQTASNVVDTLDGQYLGGFRLRTALFELDPSPNVISPEVGINEAMYPNSPGRYTTSDICSPHPVRPHLETPFTYGLNSGFKTGPRRSPDSAIFDPEPVSSRFSGIYPTSRSRSDESLPSSSSADHISSQNSPCRNTQPRCAHSESTTPCSKGDSSNMGYDKGPNQVAVPGKNIIDLDRIARGLDTRTTVMLRNIPNKVDQQTLKEYIDETSRGLYNFLYLRIDFRNICNVGYAFINFLDPLDIIDFVKAKSGTRWNKFNSEKVLDVTYANIQGIDQLVEKFRNSSVMDQDPAYRPKLFYSTGPLAGTEMEFPAANNILKKCRSISAAQQIGLFAPKLSAASKGVWRKRD